MEIDQGLLRKKVGQYKKQRRAYESYARFLKAVLKNACRQMMPYALVESRAKTLGSFAEKVVRKQEKFIQDPQYDLTDRCGARIVVQTAAEKRLACDYIRKHFLIDEANSCDKRTELKDDQFGYLGFHYIVQIKDGVSQMEGVAVPAKVPVGPNGFKAEIQVKTLLEHAWANPLHDRLYKVSIKVRSPMKRDAAGLMALLEEADGRIDRLTGQVDSLVGQYAAFLRPEELGRETAIVAALLEFEKCRASCPHHAGAPAPVSSRHCDAETRARVSMLCLRLGRLRLAGGDRDGAIQEWEYGLTCGAAETRDALKLELGYALVQRRRDTTGHPDYARGRTMLLELADAKMGENEIEVPSRRILRAEASHRLAWTYGNQRWQEKSARDLYRRALDLAPGDPYHLAAYLGYEVFCLKGTEFIECMRHYVMQAIKTCQDHIEVGIEQPRAQFTIGRLHLLLNDYNEAIDGYLRAIHLLMDVTSCTPVEVLDDEVGFLNSINLGKEMPPKHDQVRRLLLLARAAKRLQKGLGYDLKEDMSRQARDGKLGSPTRALIVAGGAGRFAPEKMEQYRQIVAWAVAHADGIVCSGGTRVGIPGLVGDEVEKLRSTTATPFKLVGYLPTKYDPKERPGDPRYDVAIPTRGDDFSPLEPIQGWVDLLGLGVAPSSVRLLGIEGGEVAVVEYRLALALGAKVAIIPGSGREADAILRDRDWSRSPNLVRLPMEVIDSPTIRAFVRPSRIPIEQPKLDELAERVHENYLEGTPYSDVDPVRHKFKNLREDLKESNRQQILYAGEILASEGFELIPDDGQDNEPPVFTPEQVERMAALEHGRWNVERLASGWKPGARKNVQERINASLKPWDELDEDVQAYDRKAIGDYARILLAAGFKIVRKGAAQKTALPRAVRRAPRGGTGFTAPGGRPGPGSSG